MYINKSRGSVCLLRLSIINTTASGFVDVVVLLFFSFLLISENVKENPDRQIER